MAPPPDNRRRHVVVLAAGQGTRMDSPLAKVLHIAAGRPLLSWVLDAAHALEPASTTVVVGHAADDVRRILPDGVGSVLQVPQNGTGHAARLAVDAVDPDPNDVVVVLPGDMPLIGVSTLYRMIETHDEVTAAVVVSVEVEDPHGYGRIVRDGEGRVLAIVEELDATPGERLVREVNTSVYSFTSGTLRRALDDLDDDNAQGEQYLTDAIGWLVSHGHAVSTVSAPADEGLGVNTKEQLSRVAELLDERPPPGSQDRPSSLP